jgi:hypothetical protein
MRATVSGLKSSGRLKARETLERSTPTSLATWLIVTGVRVGFALILASFAPPGRGTRIAVQFDAISSAGRLPSPNLTIGADQPIPPFRLA